MIFNLKAVFVVVAFECHCYAKLFPAKHKLLHVCKTSTVQCYRSHVTIFFYTLSGTLSYGKEA